MLEQKNRSRPVSQATLSQSTKFGNDRTFGVGLYRNNSVCYGEGPHTRMRYTEDNDIPPMRDERLFLELCVPKKSEEG